MNNKQIKEYIGSTIVIVLTPFALYLTLKFLLS